MPGICEVAPIGEDLSCASIPAAIAGVGAFLPEDGLLRRNSSPDFSGSGNGEEKLHWESFKTEPPSFADVVRSLGEGFVKSSEGVVKPGDGPAKEREEIVNPN
jgi:hypothetical protein